MKKLIIGLLPFLFVLCSYSDITWVDTEPGGVDTQVQYNDTGVFSGDADFTFNGTTVTATGVSATSFTVSGLSSLGSTFISSLYGTSLTSGRVPYIGTGGIFQDSSNFTFNGSTISSVGISVSSVSAASGVYSFSLNSPSITDSGLTSGRAVYSGTGGILQDSANFTFNGSTISSVGVSASSVSSDSGVYSYSLSAPLITGTSVVASGIKGNAASVIMEGYEPAGGNGGSFTFKGGDGSGISTSGGSLNFAPGTPGLMGSLGSINLTGNYYQTFTGGLGYNAIKTILDDDYSIYIGQQSLGIETDGTWSHFYGKLFFEPGGLNEIHFSSSTSEFIFNYGSSFPSAFDTSTFYFGIGTLTPSVALDVKGDISAATGTITSGTLVVNGTGSINGLFTSRGGISSTGTVACSVLTTTGAATIDGLLTGKGGVTSTGTITGGSYSGTYGVAAATGVFTGALSAQTISAVGTGTTYGIVKTTQTAMYFEVNGSTYTLTTSSITLPSAMVLGGGLFPYSRTEAELKVSTPGGIGGIWYDSTNMSYVQSTGTATCTEWSKFNEPTTIPTGW